jgi:ABC-type nitrate/sulfonate/bicarbonate transport system permease component
MSSVTEARPAARTRGPFLRFLLADRTARWTARLLLLAVWQLAGNVSLNFPTPLETAQFLVDEFRTPFGSDPWSIWNNELVRNLVVSLVRTSSALVLIVLIGVPIGYAMGRWWRVQAFFTDIVTVGLALPAFIWALLAVMWFGFGNKAPIFCAVVSVTPGVIVQVFQGSLAIPRELRDMSDAYGIRFRTQVRNLILPSMAGALITAMRLAIIAAWGCVVLVEWFGSNEGAGFRVRYWYLATNYNGLMGWGIVVLAVVIALDRGVIERIDRRVHAWRGAVTVFGARSARRTTDALETKT